MLNFGIFGIYLSFLTTEHVFSMPVVHTLRHFIQSALLSITTGDSGDNFKPGGIQTKSNHSLYNVRRWYTVLVREQLRDLTKQYDKSENDLKALQSVGQVSRC